MDKVDFLGKVLREGDEIVYIDKGNKRLRKGMIIKVADKQVMIRNSDYIGREDSVGYDKLGWGKTLRDCDCVIVIK